MAKYFFRLIANVGQRDAIYLKKISLCFHIIVNSDKELCRTVKSLNIPKDLQTFIL